MINNLEVDEVVLRLKGLKSLTELQQLTLGDPAHWDTDGTYFSVATTGYLINARRELIKNCRA